MKRTEELERGRERMDRGCMEMRRERRLDQRDPFRKQGKDTLLFAPFV